jgi:hypothetical protein
VKHDDHFEPFRLDGPEHQPTQPDPTTSGTIRLAAVHATT